MTAILNFKMYKMRTNCIHVRPLVESITEAGTYMDRGLGDTLVAVSNIF